MIFERSLQDGYKMECHGGYNKTGWARGFSRPATGMTSSKLKWYADVERRVCSFVARNGTWLWLVCTSHDGLAVGLMDACGSDNRRLTR